MRFPLYLSLLVLMAMGYLWFWPVEWTPQVWTPPPTRVVAAEAVPVEILAADADGPAALFTDIEGGMIAGVADGRFLRVGNGEVLAVRVPGRAQNCRALSSTRWLCIVSGSAMAVSEDGAVPVDRLPNTLSDLAISREGALYVSQTHNGRDPWQAWVEHAAHGRVLRYDDVQRTVTVVADGLYHASGLALAPDGSYLLVSEATEYRVSRLWLNGDRAGTRDVFIEHLPGIPAGIHWNGRDTYWLALYAPRLQWLDALAGHPALRQVLWRLPRALHPQPAAQSQVLGLDTHGRITRALKPTGYTSVNAALEHQGALFLASPLETGVAKIAQ